MTKPFWWPDTQGFLAVAIILLISIIVLILLLHPPQMDDGTRGVLMTVIGVLIASLKDVYAFFFGSSKGSAAKDETIAAITTPAKPATVPDSAKALVLLAALLLGSLAFPGDARAQIKLGPVGTAIKQKIDGATAASTSNALSNALAELAKPFQDLANFIGDDVDGAVALATVIPEIQDGHGQQCSMALASFGRVIKAHPVPLTLHVATDFEALRLLGIATNRLCANVHCTQVFADISAQAQAVSPVPLPIPALHDICSKVPQIALVDPVPVPTPDAPK